MKTKALPTQKKLADRFIREMLKSLSVAQLRTVDKRNAAQKDDRICHSHDFLDANMVMLEAWDSLTTTEASTMNQRHLAIWNGEWDKAKKQGFSRAKDRK